MPIQCPYHKLTVRIDELHKKRAKKGIHAIRRFAKQIRTR